MLVDTQHDTKKISNQIKKEIFLEYNEFACDALKKHLDEKDIFGIINDLIDDIFRKQNDTENIKYD